MTAVSRNVDAPVQVLDVDDIRGPAHTAPTLPKAKADDVLTTVIYRRDQVEPAVAELKKATNPVYGFDMEWQVGALCVVLGASSREGLQKVLTMCRCINYIFGLHYRFQV